MTRNNSEPGNGRASEGWAGAYAAFLGLLGLIFLIFLARGLYLMIAVLVIVAVVIAVLVRKIGRS